MLLLILFLISFTILGYIILRYLDIDEKYFGYNDIIGTISVSFGIANIYCILSLYILNYMLRIPLHRFLVFSIFIIPVLLIPSIPIKIKDRKNTGQIILEFIFLLLLFLSLLYTRFLLITPPYLIVGPDAGYHLSLSKQILKYGITTIDHWYMGGVANIYPPGFHLFTVIAYLISNEDFIHVYNIIPGVISIFTVLTMYTIIKRLTKSSISSFIASVLVVYSPLMIWHLLSYFGTLYGFYLLSLSTLLFMLFIEKKDKIIFILFALSMALLFLTHTTSFIFGSLILSIVFIYQMISTDNYELIMWLPVFLFIILPLILPWYLPLKPAFDYLIRVDNLADIHFGNASDFFMIGYSSIIFAFVGIVYTLKNNDNFVKSMIIVFVVFLILTNAYQTLRIRSIREHRLITFLSFPVFILSGYGICSLIREFNIKNENRRYYVYLILLIVIIAPMILYQIDAGIKHTKTIFVYISPSELEAVEYITSTISNCRDKVVLADDPFSGFNAWVYGLCECKVITNGWEPNAVDRHEPIEDAKMIFNPSTPDWEIKNLVRKENIGFIILHKKNENLKKLQSLYENIFENKEMVVLSTGLCKN